MNEFNKALQEIWGGERLRAIQNVKVGIAGAGGLGSNCAVNLVRSGFKKLVVVDFDVVEFSNLNRQFYFLNQVGMVKVEALKHNLMQINPDLELELWQDRIEAINVSKFFNDCQVIVEAFDQADAKRLLIEYWVNSGKFVVAASGVAGYGASDQIKTHCFRNDLMIVGDFQSAVGKDMPAVSPRVNLVAAKQADIILERVLREKYNE